LAIKRFFNIFKAPPEPLTVSIEPLGETFVVAKNNTILQTALKNGISFPYHCTVGTCGNCRCKLLEGEVRAIIDFSYTLSQAEIREGYILACQSLLKTNVVVDVELDANRPYYSVEKYRGEIQSTRLLTHDILEMVVKSDRPLLFSAGQFLDISLPDLARPRSYSIASPPAPNGCDTLRFYVRKVPDGAFTSWLFAQDRVGESIEMQGPGGEFWLRTADAPILAVAGGSGMAPLLSIIEDALARNITRPISYLFGARTQADLYCLETMDNIGKIWPGKFNFVPVLSEEPEGSNWAGKRGLVTNYINDESIGLPVKQCHSYLCGPPGMIDEALGVLEARGVSSGHIHYDKFLDSRQLENIGPGERIT
jgi:p-cymene methyl-monooxygenase electron transfer component